jgi:hypothetical protein
LCRKFFILVHRLSVGLHPLGSQKIVSFCWRLGYNIINKLLLNLRKMKRILLTVLLLVPAFFVSIDRAEAQTALQITTNALPNATAGQPYSANLQASGGTAPYTWATISTTYESACCVLGLNSSSGLFNTQTSSYVLPQYTGTYFWTFEVTDAVGTKVQKAVSLTILPECKINSFYSTPFSVSIGQSSTLNWSTQDCNAVQMFATNSAGNVFSSALSTNTNGSYTVNSLSTAGTYYYKLAASASGTVDPVSAPVYSIASITVVSAPTLVLSTDFAHFNYKQGDPIPTAVSGTITNTSSTQTITYNISVPNQPAWLNTGYATTTLSLGPLQAAGFGISINPTGLPTGSYSTTIYFTGSFANSPESVAITLNVSAPSGPVSTYKNVLHNGTVYYVDGNSRQPYTSAGAFLSYGFNSWNTVVPATASDLMLPISTYTPSGSTTPVTYFLPPRNGSLINDKGTVYLITNGTRAGFVSSEVFLGLGYSFANVIPGDTSFMTTLTNIDSNTKVHPDGTAINLNGTIWLVKNGARFGVPSMAVFNSWGLKLNEVVNGNGFDSALPQGTVLQTRMANQFGI